MAAFPLPRARSWRPQRAVDPFDRGALDARPDLPIGGDRRRLSSAVSVHQKFAVTPLLIAASTAGAHPYAAAVVSCTSAGRALHLAVDHHQAALAEADCAGRVMHAERWMYVE